MRGYWIREIGGVRLLTPYLREFVDRLKQDIPYRSLRWEPESKTWVARQPYVNDALEIASEFYDQMTELRLADQASDAPPSHDVAECLRKVRAIYREEAELYLLPDVPLTVVHAAYRAVALLVHPDRGGSNEQMVAVNNAYAILRRRAEERSQR